MINNIENNNKMIQPINQKHKGLPPELAAIKPPTSISECLDIIDDLKDPQNYIDKYKLYLANQYFHTNLLSINLDQFERGMKNPYVQRKYSSFETLNRCIANNVAFPALLACVIQRSVPLESVYKYCNILSIHGKLEQLNDIWKAYELIADSEHPIVQLFKNTKNPTNTLVEVMIQNDAKYILQAKTWSNEKVIGWINQNKTKSIEIISNASSSVLAELPLVIQHAFYNNAIEHFTSSQIDTKKTERDFLTNMPISYIQ